ncbi:bifunctional precorrin-2 dehydrogenase/sirohydrochlorin ferrochelatase [Pusillimonas sp.]|uniref:precorrin-2 dehydrogenase/sirohydrochlorin ferrochelatase family protein n=1 Tax=Pusillimonas sp. TaxID=3040095 RepID=UPI0029A7D26C|nr:NAD(P)-dependent oxidoreductase [Pusillimonas sp.]MDX3896238.1 NAD(P)-dependent oxidoreductase [Pusillimonas sp.]
MGSLNRLYPIFADLAGREVRIVGGGPVAERKARMLLQSNARIRLGAPALTPALQEWVHQGLLQHDPGTFQDGWLDGAWLVIAATNDDAVNARIKRLADQRRVFANVVDDPAHSSFHVPAIVDRSPLVVAISSGGAAPVLARRLRERMESLFDNTLGDLGQLAQRYREQIRNACPDTGARRRFYDWLFDGPVAELVRQGNPELALHALDAGLARPQDQPPPMLTLVNAMHADPARLTLGGLRTLHEADAIAYEDERAESLLDLARRDAARHRLGEGELHDPERLVHALAGLGKQHRCVTLLKTRRAPHPQWLDQTASRLAQAGLSFRVVR